MMINDDWINTCGSYHVIELKFKGTNPLGCILSCSTLNIQDGVHLYLSQMCRFPPFIFKNLITILCVTLSFRVVIFDLHPPLPIMASWFPYYFDFPSNCFSTLAQHSFCDDFTYLHHEIITTISWWTSVISCRHNSKEIEKKFSCDKNSWIYSFNNFHIYDVQQH